MASVKIVFYKHKVLDDGTSPIVLQIIHKRIRRIHSLKYSCKIDEWDDNQKIIKSKDKSQKHFIREMNMHFEESLLKVKKIILELEREAKNYTVDDIISKLKGVDSASVLDFIEKRIEELYKQKKDGNAQAYKNHYGVIGQFIKSKDFTFDQMTYKWLKKFETYLISRGNSTNGISFQMRTLRAIYNRAIKEKLAKKENYPFDDYKIHSTKTQKRALKKEEIIKIRDLDLTGKPAVERARDIFMFSFYCMGMSFVDIAYLKVEDIRNGRLYYSRQKTSQQYNFELLPPAMEIIKKYSDLRNPDEYVFPIIDPDNDDPYRSYQTQRQKTNHKLKDVAKLLEISTSLTSYVARHSWATIAKRSGVPTAVISEGLGHTTEKTTQIYLDSFENEVLDAANRLITL
ncbi:site-specific integrase [Ancylomarina salipaludis]|nr:site-specific integrase [Ancylomarina salipaludis]